MNILYSMTIVLALSTVVLYLCHKIKLPVIVGLLVTGVLAGPHGLGLVSDAHSVEVIAEVGVILLLFTIGIEFSVKQLARIKRSVLLGGSLQVFLTVGLVFAAAWSLASAFRPARISLGSMLFMGLLAALSSTAIVMKILQEKAQVETPHGQNCLAILIFQDIAIVPMMLVVPILAGTAESPLNALLVITLKGAAVIGLVLILARWVIPRVMDAFVKTRSRELFILFIVVLCFGIAWLTYSAGLSLSLGAFIAGLVISESEYSHQAMANITPFKDIFTSFFFISIGMLLDAGGLLENAAPVLTISLLLMAGKTTIAAAAVAILGYPLRTALVVGFCLCQVGEFSFVLADTGLDAGLMTEYNYQIFLAVSVVSMLVAPFAIGFAPALAGLFEKLPLPARIRTGAFPSGEPNSIEPGKKPKDHLIIVGFGMTGQNLARAARLSQIPYVVLDMNPVTVANEKSKGEPIVYGDASQEEILRHIGIDSARVLQIAVPDMVATRSATKIARDLNPDLHIIVRTRFFPEVKTLMELGADEVVSEDFETSIEIFTRVLRKYLIPRMDIDRFTREVRSDGYRMFRARDEEAGKPGDIQVSIPQVRILSYRIAETSMLANRTLAELSLRKRRGASVLAIRRNGEVIANPGAEETLRANDAIIVLGKPDDLARIGDEARGEAPDGSKEKTG